MSDQTFFIDRAELQRVFSPRSAKAFEDMQRRVADTEEATTAGVAATESLLEASFITLSANAELTGEYVLSVGDGLRLQTTPEGVTLYSDAPRIPSGHPVTLLASGPSTLILPLSGTVSTRQGTETLSNKTLAAPKLSGLVDAVDDAAAASAGVPVTGVYRNGGELRIRLV